MSCLILCNKTCFKKLRGKVYDQMLNNWQNTKNSYFLIVIRKDLGHVYSALFTKLFTNKPKVKSDNKYVHYNV